MHFEEVVTYKWVKNELYRNNNWQYHQNECNEHALFCISLWVQLVTVFFGITCGHGLQRTVPYYKKQAMFEIFVILLLFCVSVFLWTWCGYITKVLFEYGELYIVLSFGMSLSLHFCFISSHHILETHMFSCSDKKYLFWQGTDPKHEEWEQAKYCRYIKFNALCAGSRWCYWFLFFSTVLRRENTRIFPKGELHFDFFSRSLIIFVSCTTSLFSNIWGYHNGTVCNYLFLQIDNCM